MFSTSSMISSTELNDSYDYIIVGGGTAGCVLASRLSQDTTISVLMVERGAISDGWISRIPLLSSHFASNGSRSKTWKSTPQHNMKDREIELIGGNCLGGSTKINAMLYTRGLPSEYDSWTKVGGEGWSYQYMNSYFMRSECHLNNGSKIPESFHGITGEWPNRCHSKPFWEHTHDIIKATSALGLPYVEDPNSPYQPSHGCAKMHYTIDARGRRSSTFGAFLPKQLLKDRKDRLHILPNAIVSQLRFTYDSAGRPYANGVCIELTSGRKSPSFFIKASREVVVAAGPIGSPHLLLLSGVGSEKQLMEHGIPTVKELEGVGRNLQDHLSVPVQFRVPLQDSLVELQLRPWIIVKLLILYIFFGTGLLLAPVIELSIFIQSRLLDQDSNHVITPTAEDCNPSRSKNLPDIEIMPISWGDSSKHGRGGLTFFSVILRPTSAGSVRLASRDPFADPHIDPNYLATEHDKMIMRRAVRFSVRIKDEMKRQGYLIWDSHLPDSLSDVDIDNFVQTECRSTYHYSSTCRMAPESDGGVVDSNLCVHGISKLRIVDSSVFPNIISTHLAATTVAVAEKASDLILAAKQS